MSESVKTIFETFVKKAIMLVLNSRMKEEKDKEGKFSELDLKKSGISNISSDSDFFNVDDLFIDEYDVLSVPKCQRKTFTIDFYAKNKKTKILFERWFISYLKDEFCENDYNFYYKRLQTLLYSLYSITRILPGFKTKNNNQYEIYYKLYQNFKKEKFILTPITIFNYNCVEMNKLEVKVEYLSNDKMSRFFEGK